jgi:hypothetical protein
MITNSIFERLTTSQEMLLDKILNVSRHRNVVNSLPSPNVQTFAPALSDPGGPTLNRSHRPLSVESRYRRSRRSQNKVLRELLEAFPPRS